MTHDLTDASAKEAANRRAIAQVMIKQETDRLVAERGTAWSFRRGRAFTTATHSRFDVLEPATMLAQVLETLRLLPAEAVALAEIAAIFHVAEDVCGDGAERALAAMSRWPSVFDETDRQTVELAIEGLRPFGQADPDAGPQLLPRQRTAQRLGTGLTRAALPGLSAEDLVCAVVADADRAWVGGLHGPHRVLLNLIETERELLGVPHVSDGRDVAPEVVVVSEALADAAEAIDAHLWVLALSEGLFDELEENVNRLRLWAARYFRGSLPWRRLLDETDSTRGRQA